MFVLSTRQMLCVLCVYILIYWCVNVIENIFLFFIKKILFKFAQ